LVPEGVLLELLPLEREAVGVGVAEEVRVRLSVVVGVAEEVPVGETDDVAVLL